MLACSTKSTTAFAFSKNHLKSRQFVLLTVGIIMILDVKGCKMQIMFIRVVCGRIILRCLIIKTIIFDKCLFMGERRRFAVCLFRNPTLNGCRISHKQSLKQKCRKSANKLSQITTAVLLKPSFLS